MEDRGPEGAQVRARLLDVDGDVHCEAEGAVVFEEVVSAVF